MEIKNRWADMHIHTTKSDGTYSVRDVFEKAKKEGVEAIAITDHDTVGAVEEAESVCAEYGIEFIPGIELSAMHGSKEVHIVGLYMDRHDKDFRETLNYLQKKRMERNEKIVKKLKDNGVSVDYDELFEMTENINTAGRLHLARLLIKKKAVANIKEAFNKYLGEGKAAYVAKIKMTVPECVAMVRKNKGIPVLAHPSKLGADEMIETWAKQGLMGVEAFHPDHRFEDSEKFLKIAEKCDLLVSGGSDSHGGAKDYTDIGTVKLPYSYFEKIKKAAGKKV